MSSKAIVSSDIDYFTGERIVDSFPVDYYDGKATLKCEIVERWDEVIRWSLKCGNEQTFAVTNRYGISVVEREELESTISGSLGIKGIAEFKSEIKGKVGRELKFEVGSEEKGEFKAQSPECGRINILVYKFVRLFKLSFRDDRRWHKKTWDRTIKDWSNRTHDMTTKSPYDPDCGCDPSPKIESGGKITLLLNKISMLLDYIHTDRGIEIPKLNIVLPTHNVQDLMYEDFTFDRTMIPDYLLFLAGETENKLVGQFRPYVEVRGSFTTVSGPEGSLAEAQPDIPGKLTFLLLGAGIGAALAFLFAPKPGYELRGDIADYSKRGLDAAREGARAAGERTSERVTGAYGAARERVSQSAEAIADLAARQKEQIQAAIEAGKQAYREEKRKAEEQGQAAVESE